MSTSADTYGDVTRYGEGFQAQTTWDMMERFGANKLRPLARLAYDIFDASEYQSVKVGDRILQMAVPLIVQDMID